MAADAQVQERVRILLKGTITGADAVEIALLRNQGLVATYEELGIAQADLVQAGLLRNPTLGARVRFPTGHGLIETEFSLAQDFLDLFTLPLRKRVASAQLEAAKARVGNAVLELAAEVRQAIVSVQAASLTARIRALALEGQQAAAELRRRQNAAGNVGDLELAQEEVFYQQGKIETARAQAQVIEQREKMNRLLGVWGPESASWAVGDALPELPAQEPVLDHVESLAIARRLDLASARAEADALEQSASAAGVTRFFPGILLGVSTARDAEGTHVTGPQLDLELPIFDQGQARLARLAAQVRQARAREAELAVGVRAEVRSLRNRLLAARGVAEHYKKVVLPLRERIVKQSQLRYNSMLLGVYQLLAARREEIDGYRDYIDSIRDYWMTRADLERAAGGAIAAQEKLP